MSPLLASPRPSSSGMPCVPASGASPVLIALVASWAAVTVGRGGAAAEIELQVDASRIVGEVRPLHGLNNGPLNFGETVDLSAHYRELRVPLVRLHDSEWPDPSVVDIHAVFPDEGADPRLPESYRFARTDDYIGALVATGAGIVYRLGESIEHSARKHRVHPPADPERWAEVAIGIIRHYNEGWADGFHHGIRYWEIWNEPENRPAMWTGSDEDYYRLYEVAARAIKARFPDLKVGGPSVGATGDLAGDRLEATPFLEGLLARCRERSVPLDFFSWHTYTNDPALLPRKARAVRRWLDGRGFEGVESHLNEWNYLPDNDWSPMSLQGQGIRRERWYARMGGAEGAAFVASALLGLQDSPLDAANLYSGDSLPFGLFTRHGVPKKPYHAVKAFAALAGAGTRLEVAGDLHGEVYAGAALDRDRSEVLVLVSDRRAAGGAIALVVDGLPWGGETAWNALVVDAERDLEAAGSGRGEAPRLRVALPLRPPAVALVRLARASRG